MSTNKKLRKTKILIISILFILSSLLGYFFVNLNNFSAEAASLGWEEQSGITNPNFSNSPSSNYPFQPTGYETTSSNPKDDNDDYINGVVNLTDPDFYYENSNPNEHEYALLIKSPIEYKTRDALTLLKDSFYEISAQIYTEGSKNISTITLYDANDNSAIASTGALSTNGTWKDFHFLISTNEIDNLSVKIGLKTTSEGVALFDNLSFLKLSEKTYNNFINTYNSTNSLYKTIDKKDNELVVKDVVFGKEKNISAAYSSSAVGSYPSNANDYQVFDGKHDVAFLLDQTAKEDYSTFETKDDFLLFEQNYLYKVSVTAKTVDVKGNATISIIPTGLLNNDQSVSVTLSKTEGESLINGYSNYDFYIKSSNLKDITCKLEISFGTEEELASGKIYISNLKVLKINNSTYSAANSNLLDLSEGEAVDDDSSAYFKNGAFNSMQIDNAKTIYPATPASWDVSLTETENSIYGVVNTLPKNFDLMLKNNSITLANPDPNNSNNVLMMYNKTSNTITYKSQSKTITAGNEKHVVYVKVYAVSPVEISIVNSANETDLVLGTKTIKPDDVWQNVGIFFTSPYQDLDLAVKISLDSDSFGACFIDEVQLDKPTATDENFQANNGVDLSNLFLSGNLTKDSVAKDYSTPKFFVASGEIDGVYGILSLNSSTLSDSVNLNNDNMQLDILKGLNGTNKDFLGINTFKETYFTLTSKLGFTLSSGNYYKFSIDVFTPKINSGNGAFISLSSFENSFKNIKTGGWQTYTYYIKPDSTITTNLILGLGEESTLCSGNIFFGNIQFEKLDVDDDAAFNKLAKPNKYTLVVNEVIKENNDGEQSANNSNSGGSVNWWYILPSLFFAVTIIICVIGVLMRKVKWKKPSKKVKNSYDRNKTVSVQYYSRKASIEREKSVRELQKEIDNLSAERAKYEEKYKHDLTTMRELKIKRASAAEISALDKDMKKNKKYTSSIGVSINKLEGELSYVKSDAYLNTLIKKMSTEKVPVQSEQETLEGTNKAE